MSLLKICAAVSLFLLTATVSPFCPAVCAQTNNAPKPAPEIQALLDQARTLRRARKFAEAEPLYQQALDKSRATQDKAGEVLTLSGYGAWYVDTTKFEKGLELAQQAIALAQKSGDKSGEAVAWQVVGLARYYQGSPPKALEPFQKAAELYHQVGNRFDEAGLTMNVAVIYDNTGQPRKALPMYAKVLSIFRELGKKEDEADLLTNIAIAHNKLDEDREVTEPLRQAIALYRALDNKTGLSNALILMSQNEQAIGSSAKALQLAQEALRVAREAKSVRVETAAIAQMGMIAMKLNHDTEALNYFHSSLKMQQDAHVNVSASTLVNLGVIYSRQGDVAKAQSYLQQAIEMFRQRGDQASLIQAQINLGYSFLDLRRDKQAEPYFREALPAAEALKDRHLIASSLNGLGSISRLRNNHPEALSHYRKSLALYEELNDIQSQASTWGNIGNVYFYDKEWKQASAAQQKALALFRKAGDNHGVSNTLAGLAEIDLKQHSSLKLVERRYRDAIDAGRAAGNRFYIGNALYGLASLERRQGKWAQAEDHSRQAIALFEDVRSRIGASGEGKSEFLSANLYFYFAHLDILLQRGKTVQAFEFAQMTKARSLLDTLAHGRVDLSSVLTPEEKQQETDLRLQADSLNQQMVREGVENEIGAKKRFAALKAQLEQTERKLQVFTESLYARHPELARRRVARTAKLADMAKILPADTALLDYVALSSKEWCVFAVTTRRGKAQVRAVRLPISYQELAAQAAAFRKSCSDPRKAWEPQARKLYSVLIRPLKSWLAGKKKLIVCPDAALWDVPFAALLKGNKPLMSRFALSSAYSATGWQAARNLAQERQQTQSLKNLLVCANPDFGTSKRFGGLAELAGQRPLSDPSRRFEQPSRPLSDPSRPFSEPSRPLAEPSRNVATQLASAVPTRGGVIVSLAGTRREANSLKSLFPDATLLTEANAQESALKQEAGNYRYLHFATHGFLNDAAPMLSSVVLAVPAPDSKDDGFLTAREIYDMNLHAELAVLSACNTGRGEARSGEGMVGLTWALLCAGCPAQVVSQWSVDDAATAQLMTGFYRKLKAGKDKAESLRSASLALRQTPKHHHPYYWAAFVLMGR